MNADKIKKICVHPLNLRAKHPRSIFIMINCKANSLFFELCPKILCLEKTEDRSCRRIRTHTIISHLVSNAGGFCRLNHPDVSWLKNGVAVVVSPFKFFHAYFDHTKPIEKLITPFDPVWRALTKEWRFPLDPSQLLQTKLTARRVAFAIIARRGLIAGIVWFILVGYVSLVTILGTIF